MRKFLVLATLLTSLCFFSQAQSNAPAKVLDFIASFEKAVMTHNYEGVSAFMDAEYVKVQYKKLLKKDQEQFIDEFFSGPENIETGAGFTNTRLVDIAGIKLFAVTDMGEDQYQVSFLITRVSGFQHYNQVMLRKYKKHFGFFGAVG